MDQFKFKILQDIIWGLYLIKNFFSLNWFVLYLIYPDQKFKKFKLKNTLKVSDGRGFEGKKNVYFQLQPNFKFLMFKKIVCNLNVVDWGRR